MTGGFDRKSLFQKIRLKEDSGFLPGLSEAGAEKVMVLSISSAAGKGKMARPGIVRMSDSPEDQKTLVGVNAFYNGDGSRGRFG